MIKHILKLFHYYTIWALILHLLYHLNIIGNTYIISLMVILGSIICSYVYPGYIYNLKYIYIYIVFDILIHWLPFIILHNKEHKEMNYKILFCSMFFYMAFFKFNICNIVDIYREPEKYIMSDK